MIDEKWCDRADQSAKNAHAQLDLDTHKIELRKEFWRGYRACVEEVREHLRRAQQEEKRADGETIVTAVIQPLPPP